MVFVSFHYSPMLKLHNNFSRDMFRMIGSHVIFSLFSVIYATSYCYGNANTLVFQCLLNDEMNRDKNIASYKIVVYCLAR